MTLQAGKMYRPSDIAFDVANDAVYVAEQFNHRISKWVYTPGFFNFSLADGNVTSLTLANGGTSGYVNALLVIEGPAGTSIANATVSAGNVTTITVTNGGSGYTTPPNVSIVSVTGSGATATANLIDGIVTSITVTNQGSSYVSTAGAAPEVVIDAPPGKSLATGTATTNGTLLTAVTLVSNGNGYTNATPTVTVIGTSGNSNDASVTAAATIVPWGNNGDGTTGQGGPIGDGGPTDNNLYRPSGIVFDGTRLVVTDTFHDRIRTLAIADGAFIASVGSGGFGTSNFYRPAGIAVDDALTFLVIADELNHRAVRYSVGATPSSPQVLPAPTPLSFVRPHGVIFDSSPNLFQVTDSARSIINQYDITATNFVVQHGTPGTTGTDLFFPSSGHGILAATDTVFADTRNNIIKTIDGTTINNTTNTTPGTGDGQIYYPESVSAFTDGASYVLAANTLNHRVEAFSNIDFTLNFEANFGTP